MMELGTLKTCHKEYMAELGTTVHAWAGITARITNFHGNIVQN